jgi:UDP-2-acetamido-3-amino-2,3-dideoxy-glucuronate N-acetyltransferase
MNEPAKYAHPSAVIEEGVTIGAGCRVWALSQIRAGAVIGSGTIVGRNVFIDKGVMVGANCKVQNNALIYAPAVLEEGVFIGPAAVITNDVNPRAVNPDGSIKTVDDWSAPGVHVGAGSAVGANATVVAGVRIGRWTLVAAGAVVTTDVADHAIVAGVPARQTGWVGHRGHRLKPGGDSRWLCPVEGTRYDETPMGLVAI